MAYDTFLLPASVSHTRKSMSDNGPAFAESHKNLIDLSPGSWSMSGSHSKFLT